MKRLTVKESKLVALKAQGATHAQAYKQTYSQTAATNTATSNTDKILKKPHIKTAMEIALKKHDINLNKALLPIAEGLEATKTATYEGEVLTSTIPDYSTRLAASDRALKLLGVNQGEQQGSFHLHLHSKLTNYEV